MSMIPQFGFAELFLLAAVALVVVGPRDLPRLLRGLGQVARSARGLAREFRSSFEEMAREADLDDVRREVDELRRINPVAEAKSSIEDAVRPAADDIDRELRKPIDEQKAGE